MTVGSATLTHVMPRTQGPDHKLVNGRSRIGMGIHFLVEMWSSPFARLADATVVAKVLDNAGQGGSEIVGHVETRVHQFNPYGVSGTASSSLAHIVIHTWPENSYAAVDIYAPTRDNALQVLEQMKADLQPEYVNVLELNRGQLLDLEDT